MATDGDIFFSFKGKKIENFEKHGEHKEKITSRAEKP